MVANNGPCGSRHIHFVVNSELDPQPLEGLRDKRTSNTAGRTGTQDSSMYLNDRLLEIGAYTKGCDDFNVKLLVSKNTNKMSSSFSEGKQNELYI